MPTDTTKRFSVPTTSNVPDALDVESLGGNEDFQYTPLQRQLKDRHIAMISLGGVIGTGLFLGTASSLQTGGPVGLLLGYVTIGSLCFSVMVSLGEMIAFLPLPGGHIKMAERFVGPALSFTIGWNAWYNWTIGIPVELSAATILINYWNKDINNAAWITMCLGVAVIINLFGAGTYGEAEFIFASIKVIAIVGLIILGVILDLGGGPNRDRLGFRYWKNPGPFVNYQGITGAKGQFLGFWTVLTQAAFSFIGTEVVAISAGEAKNPRQTLPKAIRKVYVRIILFYILGTLVIGLLVPSSDARLNLNDGTAASSPFVIAIENAGLSVLPHIINAALLTSAWSAAASDLYTSSRALYGLAATGNAPRVFLITLKNGLPIVSILTCASSGLLAYMSVNETAGKVFGWFASIAAVAGLMSWFGISITYIRFYAGLKAQGIDRKELPYYNRLNPYLAWYSMIFSIIIAFFSGWSVFLKGQWATDSFITKYLPLVMFPTMWICSAIYHRQFMMKTKDMDFVGEVAEVISATEDEAPPKAFVAC
ncbi:amino acid permease [Guyanagaster necrorhizus]|uniref:Amino acid permease n=1 Tax=Guyanagaster necrorhizus TaxID=856835 RepID=A0A9P7W1I5_9AGAR|nr:amino acid permease [Guyanagaster necrorhizus MCA 3950]KAG7450864.1 amino acid permease [Guyanagaster necrorhizus MCA 3950]